MVCNKDVTGELDRLLEIVLLKLGKLLDRVLSVGKQPLFELALLVRHVLADVVSHGVEQVERLGSLNERNE